MRDAFFRNSILNMHKHVGDFYLPSSVISMKSTTMMPPISRSRNSLAICNTLFLLKNYTALHELMLQKKTKAQNYFFYLIKENQKNEIESIMKYITP